MLLEKYKHIKYQLKPNKNKIPVNNFTFEDLDEFNSIYKFVRNNFKQVKHTQS